MLHRAVHPFVFLACYLLFSTFAHASDFQTIQQQSQFATRGAVHSITPLDKHRYLLAAYSEGVILVDFSQPHTPQIMDTARFSKQAESIALSPSKQRLYVANGSGGLDILALRSNGTMALLGRIDTPSYAFDVALSPDSKTVFVADNSAGVAVIDVSQSAQPRIINTIPTPAAVASVTLSRNGQQLFIAEQANGVRIFDVRNPSAPVAIAHIKTQGHAQSLALSHNGHSLFSANNTGGLQLFDIRNLQNPQPLSQLKTHNAFSVTLTADNRYALVGDLFGGVKVIEVTQPTQPRLTASLKTRGHAEQALPHPDRKTLLIADNQAGVNIISFR